MPLTVTELEQVNDLVQCLQDGLNVQYEVLENMRVSLENYREFILNLLRDINQEIKKIEVKYD